METYIINTGLDYQFKLVNVAAISRERRSWARAPRPQGTMVSNILKATTIK